MVVHGTGCVRELWPLGGFGVEKDTCPRSTMSKDALWAMPTHISLGH